MDVTLDPAMSVSPSGWVCLLVLSVVFPYLAVRTAHKVRQPGGTPTAAQHFTAVVVSQGMTFFVAWFAVLYDGLELFPPLAVGRKDVVLAVAFLVLSLGTLPLRWRWKPLEERRRNLWIFPRSPRDLGRWAAIALIAGIVEEIAYRGALLQLWQRVLGSWWPAMLLCVAVFSLSHFVQGWRAMLAIVVLAAASHAIVRITGALYTAMFVHAVYDFLAGVIVLRLARQEGLLNTEAAAAPAP